MSGTCPVRVWVGVSPPRADEDATFRRLQTYRRHSNPTVSRGSSKIHKGIDISFYNNIALFSFVLMLMVC